MMKQFFMFCVFCSFCFTLWGHPQGWPNYEHKTHHIVGVLGGENPEIDEENNAHFVRFYNAFQANSAPLIFSSMRHLVMRIKGNIDAPKASFLSRMYPKVEALTLFWDGVAQRQIVADNLIQYLKAFSELKYLHLEYPLDTGNVAEILKARVQDIPKHTENIQFISHGDSAISGEDFVSFIEETDSEDSDTDSLTTERTSTSDDETPESGDEGSEDEAQSDAGDYAESGSESDSGRTNLSVGSSEYSDEETGSSSDSDQSGTSSDEEEVSEGGSSSGENE